MTCQEQRNLLRTALANLVGDSSLEMLLEMEAAMRLMPMPAEDRAASIDAIHALLATREEPTT